MYKLRVARWVVSVKLGQAREAEERERRYRESEKEVEAGASFLLLLLRGLFCDVSLPSFYFSL